MNDEQPNILLITTDQQRFDTIAALGNREIYTPHLDWLVDEGITFTRAYADCPICVPARCSIMSGRHAHALGMTTNGGMECAMPGRATLPGLLTDAGYQTRAQGKMHFAPMRCHYGFEHMELPMDYYRERQRRHPGAWPKQHGVGENEMTPVISTVHEQDSLTHWTVARSIDFLETRDTTRPFFLWTSFTKPHPPFDPCANYWALYDGRPVSEPILGDWSQDLADMPQGFLTPSYMLNNAWRMSPAQLQDAKRAYYACITQIDYQLGLLYARLREMDLLRKTWIVFTSDHGEMLGDHHMGAKTTFFEGSAHVPLIIRPPDGHIVRGKRVDLLAQHVDLLPTITGLAGVVLSEECDGTDLLTLSEDRCLVGAAGDQAGVLEGRLKYCYTRTGGQELLFDLAEDPMETRDLSREEGRQEDLTRLRQTLIDRLAPHLPDWIAGGELAHLPGINGPQDVDKWPGFHSLSVDCDVLH